MSRVLVAGLALLLAGCGEAKAPETAPPTTAAKASAEPEKYTGKTGCRYLAQRVPGLPALLQDSVPGAADQDVLCEFGDPAKGGPFVEVTFSTWKNDPADPGRGRQRARERFASTSNFADDGEADVRLGEKAKWQHRGTGCQLAVLDENAVLQIRYDVFGGAGLDPSSEQCRTPLRDLAKPIYDAVQP
ncbi:hypothetical protein [Lentzea flava]|uniref:DUF3558 domain-containing protein n=1 Tax=Lentzea flava TaxID=103732 RepID=A0ABQ2UTT7_9PSEU|nr:hypothetical protein [Lentzea flava]GGU49765.1 hypothetical protein GCM10010178_48240 [Lentzea flava]